MSKKLKMIDLCAGTGAFTLAFEKTGKVDVVFANDMIPASKEIYDINFSHKLTLGDLHSISDKQIPSHDIFCCGWPCQPVSQAGNKLGFKDPRANIFWKMMSIIDYHKPKCVILENVKNLVSHDGGKTFKTVTSNLTKRGYYIKYNVLNTADITGIPQNRERIYMVCFKDRNTFTKFDLDFKDQPQKSLSAMFEPGPIPNKYYYGSDLKVWSIVKAGVIKKNTIYQFRRVYVRENKSGECPTLTANMGTGGHNVPLILDNKGIRKLTPRECFNFQGFPVSYKLPKLSDSNLYKLAGNAVSVPVIELIADRLIPLIS